MTTCGICGGDKWDSWCEACGKHTPTGKAKDYKPLTLREIGLDPKEPPRDMRSPEARRHARWREEHDAS